MRVPKKLQVLLSRDQPTELTQAHSSHLLKGPLVEDWCLHVSSPSNLGTINDYFVDLRDVLWPESR